MPKMTRTASGNFISRCLIQKGGERSQRADAAAQWSAHDQIIRDVIICVGLLIQQKFNPVAVLLFIELFLISKRYR